MMTRAVSIFDRIAFASMHRDHAGSASVLALPGFDMFGGDFARLKPAHHVHPSIVITTRSQGAIFRSANIAIRCLHLPTSSRKVNERRPKLLRQVIEKACLFVFGCLFVSKETNMTSGHTNTADAVGVFRRSTTLVQYASQSPQAPKWRQNYIMKTMC
jgi:hypothetical protein